MPVAHRPPAPLPIIPVLDAETPVVKVTDLQFAYPDGHQALRSISFSIQRGEKVALVGSNGAGKSTLMLHLNGILGNERSPVQIAGLGLLRANLPVIRAKVGLVFQNPDDQLFSPTVFDDVAFGPLHMGLPETEVRARVQTALAQVGMAEFSERLSHHLSVGQKKKVAVATVLSMSPEILVLDEPSAGLDPRGRRGLIDLLHALPLTMLVSSHDLWLVRELFPRTIMLDAGQVVADGPTEAILTDSGLLARHGLEAM